MIPEASRSELNPAPPAGVLFARGFRPFFLCASALAVLLLGGWLAVLFGDAGLAGPRPFLWHGHEMVYGFTLAVIAGFLLTAVENWTGQTTARGLGLALLVGLFVLGRVAAFVDPARVSWAAQALELAFLPVLIFVLGRCIAVAKSWRNAGFPALLLGLWLCDGAFLFGADPSRALARAADLVIVMIVVIAARVFPMFTRGGAGLTDVGSWPRADAAALAAVLATFAAAVLDADARVLATLEALSALLLGVRMIPWQPWRTWRVPLVWALHAGHAFLVLGFALRALHHAAGIGTPAIALHAHTIGAIGIVTLAMMTRVGLGHTGRALVAPPAMSLAFGLISLAGVVRVLTGLVEPGAYRASLLASGLLFAAAHLLYLWSCAPALWAPRADGKPD